MPSGSVWGVDIGKSSLKAVRMRRGRDELEVQALFYHEYEADEDGSISHAEAGKALDALVAKYPQIKGERVHVALPGHTSFSRFIKLPAFDDQKLRDMVRYEAQQQIPFPIADVNWDYSAVEREYEPGEDRDVGLFAIKKEVVYGLIGDLQLAGVEPAAITTTPLSLYNFVCYDLDPPQDQATVLLDIGWSTTDLVIIDGARYWIRNLVLNGTELTKAISAKMKASFREAETSKRNAAQEKESRKLYQATELVLRDFVLEIQKSIAFYKRENKDREVKIGQVLLLGNGAKLPNVRPFFQKELGLPVETVKRLSRLTLDVDVDPDEVELLKEHLPSFGVAFGLGIQGAGEGLNQVNLLPEEIRRRQALERKKPLVAVAVALIWAVVIASHLVAGKTLDGIAAVAEEADKNLSWLEKNKRSVRGAAEPIAGLEKRIAALAAHTLGRNLPLEALDKLARVLPKGNADLAPISPSQQRDLETQGKNVGKMAALQRDLEQAQDRLNDGKIWIVDFQMKPILGANGAVEAVQVSMLCARKFLRNAQGIEDDGLTKQSIETGLLADIQREFKDASFETTPRKIWNLDKDAQPPQGPLAVGAQAFCAIPIGFVYRGDGATTARIVGVER